MTRDWLHVADPIEVNRAGRVLEKTPHELGVMVAHQMIEYGTMIERLQDGYVAKQLKTTIFRVVRNALIQHSH